MSLCLKQFISKKKPDRIRISQSIAVGSRDSTGTLNIACIGTTFLLFYSLLVVNSMDVIRSFSVFCSYKLEFCHECLSVSQKTRIKKIFSISHRPIYVQAFHIALIYINSLVNDSITQIYKKNIIANSYTRMYVCLYHMILVMSFLYFQ